MINPDLVEITDSHFIVELMYAGTTHNMTGYPVYAEMGLGNHAYVHKDLWEKLQNLIPWLDNHYMKLKIYDAYRPAVAHAKLKEIIPQPGFFAVDPANSPHCRGTAVDVALVDEKGNELEYPTAVDAYTPNYAREIQDGKFENFFAYLKKARHDYQNYEESEKIRNRDILRQLMESIGLKALDHEWWHYELPDGRSEKYPMQDY